MPAQWERWLRYAKAKLDDTVKRGDAEMDRLEAEQRAKAEGKPWLASEADAPTLDEARARIEHQAEEARRAEAARRAEQDRRTDAPALRTTDPGATDPPHPAPDPADVAPSAPPADPAPPPLATDPQLGTIDFAAQQRAADDRLAAMRRELGLDDKADEDPPPKR